MKYKIGDKVYIKRDGEWNHHLYGTIINTNKYVFYYTVSINKECLNVPNISHIYLMENEMKLFDVDFSNVKL